LIERMTLAFAGAVVLWAAVGDPPATDDPQERQRIARAQSGDKRALGELLSRHGPALYWSVLLPRLGSEAAAQDALSEVYARVVARIGSFEWQGVGFWPWLRVVALRVALDQLRSNRRLVLYSARDMAQEADDATPVDQALSNHRDREASRRRVEQALSRIHPRYAQAIRLRVLEDQPREQAAQALGVTASTFDVVLHRAMQALRKALAREAQDA
jgi:RNA polymerase sigma-70 factor (ECF subfamily)